MTSKPVSQIFKDLIHHLWAADFDNTANVKCVYMFCGMLVHPGLTLFQGRQISAAPW